MKPVNRDPKTPREVAQWLKLREIKLAEIDRTPADTPLSAREWVTVNKGQSKRPRYSKT